MELNFAKQPHQPTGLKVHRSQNCLNFIRQHSHSNKIRASVTSNMIRLHYLHSRPGLQRTNLLKNSQDNDKLPPDLNAAQSIIHVAEHKVKSFTVLRTHLHEFYEFLHKSLSSCWTGGWQRQQQLWSQVWRKDLYFCWPPHRHWDEPSKHPWCGNMTSHYRQRSDMESYAGRSKWQHVWQSEAKRTHWLLWGKSSRCCIVTKGWLRASAGAILSSASINNIFFSRPTNSLRSAFSASKSLPSRFITKFTWMTNILLLKQLVKTLSNILKEKSNVKWEMLHYGTLLV